MGSAVQGQAQPHSPQGNTHMLPPPWVGSLTMKATKPLLRPRRRCSSSRGHMIFTLAMGPNLQQPGPNSGRDNRKRPHPAPFVAGRAPSRSPQQAILETHICMVPNYDPRNFAARSWARALTTMQQPSLLGCLETPFQCHHRPRHPNASHTCQTRA